VTGIAVEAVCPVPAAESAAELTLLRFERERAALQREIAQLQSMGDTGPRLDDLLRRKGTLSQEIDRLRAA
jgi:hypothetical protein